MKWCLLVFFLNCLFAETESQRLAKELMNDENVRFMRRHPSSNNNDGAAAWDNISDTSEGKKAKVSRYGKAPGGYAQLDVRVLRALKKISESGYKIRISSMVGASHSARSRHYKGLAVDINTINDRPVSWQNPYYKRVLAIFKSMGADQLLGPGDEGHSAHIHAAWR